MRARAICLVTFLAGCGPTPPSDQVETLTPEPAGAPTAVADGRLTCLGNNPPPQVTSQQVVLPGWTRFFTDPTATNDGASQTPVHAVPARIEAFSSNGASLGSTFASATDGRAALTVPITGSGFTGHLEATCDAMCAGGAAGLIDYHFWTNRPYTQPQTAGWAWMMSQADLTAVATKAGVTVDGSKAIAAIAVHDCDGFGVGNAVVTVGGSASGGIYFDGFDATAGTFTAASGRVAFANLPPGSTEVKAFGRTDAGGPLTLLASITVDLKPGVITGIDLEPRNGTK